MDWIPAEVSAPASDACALGLGASALSFFEHEERIITAMNARNGIPRIKNALLLRVSQIAPLPRQIGGADRWQYIVTTSKGLPARSFDPDNPQRLLKSLPSPSQQAIHRAGIGGVSVPNGKH